MKVDLYTKVVLAGILICLSLLLLRDAPIEKKAFADVSFPAKMDIHLYHFFQTKLDIDD